MGKITKNLITYFVIIIILILFCIILCSRDNLSQDDIDLCKTEIFIYYPNLEKLPYDVNELKNCQDGCKRYVFRFYDFDYLEYNFLIKIDKYKEVTYKIMRTNW